MKVCPICQNRYDGGEKFCPRDGTELVTSEQSPGGDRAGTVLDGGIRLDQFRGGDALGDRYTGSLAEGSREVAVTVFDRGARPREGRVGRVESLVDRLTGPLPESILGLHSYSVRDSEPAFVVEEAPSGRSLRTFLEENGSLDWRPACRIAAHLARSLEWMARRGHFHRGVYPESIYLSESNWVGLQVGDWMQASLTYHETPLEAADDERFVGFAPYMAPETLREGGDVDERSLVYTIGMILYETILGNPPFTSGETIEILERHLHEKPVRISIAADGNDLHPELEDVLEMMWAKEPSERFQRPGAAVAALASLVEEDPAEFAPEPTPAEEPVFPGGAALRADGPDRGRSEGKSRSHEGPPETPTEKNAAGGDGSEDSEPKSVESGEVEIPTAARDSSPEQTASSDSDPDAPSIIIEDPELESAVSSGAGPSDDSSRGTNRNDEPFAEQVPRWTEALEAGSVSTKKASLLGFSDIPSDLRPDFAGDAETVQVRILDFTGGNDAAGSESADASPRGAAAETVPTAETKVGGLESEPRGDGSEDPTPPSDGATPTEIRDQPREDSDSPPATGTSPAPESSVDPPSSTRTPPEMPNDEPDGPDEDVIVLDTPSEMEVDSPSQGRPEPPEIPENLRDDEDESAEDRVSDSPSETGDSSDLESSDDPDADSDIAAPGSRKVYTGDREQTTDVSDQWFEVSDEDAWMASDVRKERDRSEIIRQYATRGFIALLVVTALFLIVYSQTYSPGEPPPEQESGNAVDE